ncbi:hypothetical protein K435DRAFT_809070 [Dendrothele bispora CBS 962.96]|uniref:CCHC-type domain-containing protein n=1 Tax=Dendrothele bispora (strain CBS 962.96) TaxID=1314807 RepID=A0A4V4HC06_DENBC|nr:hypothetical protein K435DRAFT_809070 [Dendrothele bispora CBS 962.96]
MSSPFTPFDEINPWSDAISSGSFREAKPEIKDASVTIDEVAETRAGVLNDSFIHPSYPLSSYSIQQKGDYFREVPKLDADGTNWADFKENWMYATYAAEIGHLVESKFEPPEFPELGTGRGANAAYDADLRSYNAYKLLENQCRVFLVQKLPSDVRRDVMDGTSCCRDIWFNLVKRFQVKVENDTADLKAPMPTQVIYDELRREYNSRNPKLPEWAKSKDKAAQSSSNSSSSKPQHALQAEEEKKKKKKDFSDYDCYGCGEKGHIKRFCPDKDDEKKKKKKKKDGKEKEKEKSKEKDEDKSKAESESKSSEGSEKGKGKESQANAVEEIEYAYSTDDAEDEVEYAYMAETLFEDSEDDVPDLQDLSDSDDEDWDDDSDDEEDFLPSRRFLNPPCCDEPTSGGTQDLYILTDDLVFDENAITFRQTSNYSILHRSLAHPDALVPPTKVSSKHLPKGMHQYPCPKET